MKVTPHVGVWIEIMEDEDLELFDTVTPHVGVWIEIRFKWYTRIKY